MIPNRIRTLLLPRSDELASMIADGSYDENGCCPSFCQFDGQRRRHIAELEGISTAETYRHLPDDGLKHTWMVYLAARYNRGVPIPTRLWRMLPWHIKAGISRTPRGRQRRLTPRSTTAPTHPPHPAHPAPLAKRPLAQIH